VHSAYDRNSRSDTFRWCSDLLLTAPSLAQRRLRGIEVLGPHIQEGAGRSRVFADGSWGGTFRDGFTPQPGEVIESEHWCSSGFANTDLDLQLKKHGIHQLIVIGLRANTCIDSTVRYAAELGYEVTLVNDAIGSYSWDEMKATLELNAPNYARTILSTKELIASIQKFGD
jgi:ureidoacrylate peracid hydrolase